MSDTKKSKKSTKRTRSDATPKLPLTTRLYAIESNYGDKPMYVLYTSHDPSRSKRVHDGLNELVVLDNEKGMPLAWGLFSALIDHKSLSDRANMDNVLSMGSLYTHKQRNDARDTVHTVYMKIGDTGLETDDFVTLANDCDYEDEPFVSFLRFQWNA